MKIKDGWMKRWLDEGTGGWMNVHIRTDYYKLIG